MVLGWYLLPDGRNGGQAAWCLASRAGDGFRTRGSWLRKSPSPNHLMGWIEKDASHVRLRVANVAQLSGTEGRHGIE